MQARSAIMVNDQISTSGLQVTFSHHVTFVIFKLGILESSKKKKTVHWFDDFFKGNFQVFTSFYNAFVMHCDAERMLLSDKSNNKTQ
jgi:hypothetical protein